MYSEADGWVVPDGCDALSALHKQWQAHTSEGLCFIATRVLSLVSALSARSMPSFKLPVYVLLMATSISRSQKQLCASHCCLTRKFITPLNGSETSNERKQLQTTLTSGLTPCLTRYLD